jgi:hypothetical protein
MNTTLKDLLNHKERVIGGQIETRHELAIHRGLIADVTLVGMYLHFTLTWYAHRNGNESNPIWIELPIRHSMTLNINCALRRIGEYLYHFEIWDSDVHRGPAIGCGNIFLRGSPDGLIDPHIIRGLTQEVRTV